MPRPEITEITFTIDGREVVAPENAMLVDAAKYGDVEIPVFCYEPKLGNPVGACRMCLVEIEGIPKLQTACSTPVKDGMVVHTQTDRVHEAQRAVVEFLLINHPLDCPVCDKGGECPLQDITYGWGPGTSRFIEPKRHFKKPLELSPLIAIDRERCILCYRCVRFSQEIAEDYQLVLLERGAHSFVGTFDGHPYVAPFSGNIVELCPVGALTSSAYRFRARPWDIQGAGTVCTLCPAQCNVTLTVRDDRVLRALARDNAEVDDGWLCDKGRFGYQHVHADERIREPLVREGDSLRAVSWDKALDAAAGALRSAGEAAAAVADGETTNEEAHLLGRLFREHLGSGRLAAGLDGSAPVVPAAEQATIADLEFAHAVVLLDCDPIDEAPVWDLRIRKGVRRRGVRVAVASARPTSLDPSAELVVRLPPGGGEAFLVALDAELSREAGQAGDDSGPGGAEVGELAALLREAGTDVVLVYPERLVAGSRTAGMALRNVARRLELAGRDGAGLLEIPSGTNSRGVREAGFTGAVGESPAVLYLLHADPLRHSCERAAWEQRLASARTVIAHESFLTETVREHADVVFPAETYPEREGTVTHPDGRVQRLRVAVGRPRAASGVPGSGVRPGWQVIADVARRCGQDLGVLAASMASQQLFASVPRYAGLTLDAIGGQGARPAAGAGRPWEPVDLPPPAAVPDPGDERLRLGIWRPLWAAKEVDASPHLQFARPRQVVELAPVDAERLGIGEADVVEVSAGDGTVTAPVRLRHSVPPRSVFLVAGTEEEPANALAGALVTVRRVAAPDAPDASAVPAMVTPAGEGLAEAPQSAPLESPPGTGFSRSGGGGFAGGSSA